jgi:hypothetical protein
MVGEQKEMGSWCRITDNQNNFFSIREVLPE